MVRLLHDPPRAREHGEALMQWGWPELDPLGWLWFWHDEDGTEVFRAVLEELCAVMMLELRERWSGSHNGWFGAGFVARVELVDEGPRAA